MSPNHRLVTCAACGEQQLIPDAPDRDAPNEQCYCGAFLPRY